MSLSAYMMAMQDGPWTYQAIPVFLSRMFRHSSICIRSDRGIHALADLRGKRIGVPEYTQTAGLTARGVLEDEYGVSPTEIHWVSGGLEQVGRQEKFPLQLPGVTLEYATARSLSQMLAEGALDGIVSAANPSCFDVRGGSVARLFPNYRHDEAAYYTKTGIFPIMHVVGIRRSLVEQHPWLAVSVAKAYAQAKAIALEDLDGAGGANKATVPWLPADVEEVRTLMGNDWWPYGLAANRAALEAATQWSFTQGLTKRKLDSDELFIPSTRGEVKI